MTGSFQHHLKKKGFDPWAQISSLLGMDSDSIEGQVKLNDSMHSILILTRSLLMLNVQPSDYILASSVAILQREVLAKLV